jgi:hypothetical protein
VYLAKVVIQAMVPKEVVEISLKVYMKMLKDVMNVNLTFTVLALTLSVLSNQLWLVNKGLVIVMDEGQELIVLSCLKD